MDTDTMDTDALLHAYDTRLRQWIPPQPPAGWTYERVGPVVRVTGQYRGFVDPPRDPGVRGAELDALIREHRDFFAARGEAVEWKTRGHDLPVDLPERLAAAGFVPEERETVVVGRAADLAGPPRLPDGVTLRPVTARADLDRIAALETAVWDADFAWLAADLEQRMRSAPDQLTVLVVEAGGEVVSAAWLVGRPGTGFAALWGGSTLQEWRGRGIYRALVAERARIAVAAGVEFLQVDASDDSRPILERLGLHAITTTTPYVWSPPAGNRDASSIVSASSGTAAS